MRKYEINLPIWRCFNLQRDFFFVCHNMPSSYIHTSHRLHRMTILYWPQSWISTLMRTQWHLCRGKEIYIGLSPKADYYVPCTKTWAGRRKKKTWDEKKKGKSWCYGRGALLTQQICSLINGAPLWMNINLRTCYLLIHLSPASPIWFSTPSTFSSSLLYLLISKSIFVSM